MKSPVQDSHLTLRDKLLRDNFTLAETLLCCILILCSLAVLYPGQPRSNWLLCFFFIIGALTPVLLKTHEVTHPFFIDNVVHGLRPNQKKGFHTEPLRWIKEGYSQIHADESRS